MPKIILSSLNSDFAGFKKDLEHYQGLVEYIQIDVMDGVFVSNKSFAEIEKINELKTDIKFELHLMVENPLLELEKWADVKNIFRVIFHIEAKSNPREVINYARGKCWQVGVALNPDTPFEKITPYLDSLDSVLFMTVYPGKQGAPFVSGVLKKIENFVKLPTHPLCAVDGGVNKNTITELKNSGVEIFCVGSALTMADDPKKAYNELMNKIK